MKASWQALTLYAAVASQGVKAASCPPSEEPLKMEPLAENKPCVRPTEPGDEIKVHYKGTLLSNGKKFDSSYDRGIPFNFHLGAHQVITGWDEGMKGLCIGHKRKLTIAPEWAYGNRAMGQIPACSTLVFETELLEIIGLAANLSTPGALPMPEPLPDLAPGNTTEPTLPEEVAGIPPPPPAEAEKLEDAEGVPPNPQDQGAEDSPNAVQAAESGECRLLGPFALIVQSALGLLAMLSLVFKRWRERPRRPLKIWAFDASKQIVGTALLHVFNIAMSEFSSGAPVISATKATSDIATQIKDASGNMPNPCSFYLLNLAIDTTIGIPVLVVFLNVLHKLFLYTSLANPPESIKSGNYGQPPRVTWWMKQCLIYFIGLFLMKMFVFFLFQALPWLAWVGDWALRWTEGNESLQIAFVMFLFPLAMNALQYYIVDSYIKNRDGVQDQGEGQGYESVQTDDAEGGEEDGHRHVIGEDDDDDDKDAVDVTSRIDEPNGHGSSSGTSITAAAKDK